MFHRYYNREKETINSFWEGWFRTGDFSFRDENGCYKILGRISIDIIKKAGWKISALEIED
jgi:malonyl-CoA/methylmalonyl-CoA synthetase